MTAWKFLEDLYQVPNFKGSFEVAALHPYGTTISEVARSIEHVREVLNQHGGRKTPLWVTELGWGSGQPDAVRIDEGSSRAGQAVEQVVQDDSQPSSVLENPSPAVVRLA